MSEPEQPKPTRRLRRWHLAIAAVLVCVALVVAVVHLPFVRSRALTWVVTALERQGMRLEAGGLQYNLLALRVTLRDVRLTADHATVPFFEADRVQLDVPWSILGGGIRVQSVEVNRPRITLVRGTDGTLNLPPFGDGEDDGPGIEGPIRMGRLLVTDLTFRYEDNVAGYLANTGAVTLDMRSLPGTPLGGQLSSRGGTTLRIEKIDTTTTVLDGDLSFDGYTLTARSLSVETPEVQVSIDGDVDLIGEDPELAIRYTAHADVARVAPWIPLDPAPAGRVSVTGNVSGQLADPLVNAAVTSENLVWPHLGAVALTARGSWSSSTATIETARVGVAGGELTAQGRIQFDDTGASDVRAEWQALDLERLLRLAPDLPVRIASVTNGSLTASWTGDDYTGATADVRLALQAASAPMGTLPLTGSATIALANHTWTLTTRQDLARAASVDVQARGRLADALDNLSTSTLGGRAAVVVSDVDGVMRALDNARLMSTSDLVGRIRGSISSDVGLQGSLGVPRASGTLEIQDAWFDQTGPVTLHTTLDASPRLVVLDTLRAALGANSIDAQVRLGIADNTLSGTVAATLPDLRALTGSLPDRWRPQGAATLSATLSGPLDNPAVNAAFSSQDIVVAGQAFRTVQGDVAFADRVAVVKTLEITQDTGQLAVAGRYDIDTRGYSFTATGTGLVVAPIVLDATVTNADGATTNDPIPVDARFNLRLEGTGTSDNPSATGQLEFTHVTWDGYEIGAAQADLSVNGDVGQARILVPSIAATIDSTMAIEAGTFTATVDIADADIAALARATGPASARDSANPPPVVGTLSLHATAEGRFDDIAQAVVAIDLSRADATVNGVPIRLEQAAQLGYGHDTITAEQVALRIGDARLTAHGRMGAGAAAADALELALTGSVADFLPMAQMIEGAENIRGSGAIAMRVRATGPFDTPEVLGYLTLTEASVASEGLPAIEGVTMAASYSAGLLNVNTLTGRWQGADIAATAYIPLSLLTDSLPAAYRASLPPFDGPARGEVHVTGVTPAALAPFVASDTIDQLAGQIDLVANVEASAMNLDGVSADITLTRAAVEMARIPLEQAHPTQLRFANRRLDVVEFAWAGGGSYFDVGGYVVLADDGPRLNVGASGSLDLRMLSAFSRNVATAGRADFDIRAFGTTADPVIEGTMLVADTDVIVRDPRVAVTELAGEMVFTANRIAVRNLKASANGGTLAIDGAIDYTDFAISGGALTVTGREMAIEAVEGLRTEVNVDLTLGATDDTPRLAGRVSIVRGDYRRSIQLTEQLLALGTPRPVVGNNDTPGILDRLQIDVAVVSNDDIIVNNNYARLDVSSNLRVIGTGVNPVLAGRLTLREGGEVYLGGQTYQVRRGTVDFTNATRIEPTFNLALDTRVQRYDVTLEVNGTPQTLDVALRSPGLSQQEAISLLLTGQVSEQASMAYSEIARGQLIMLLSGELLSAAGRSIGLDAVQVSRGLGGAASTFDLLATESDPDTRLTLSKNLSEYLELIFSQSLRESGDITWIASYRPTRRLEFRGTTDDSSTQTYEFRHEIEFGGGPYALATPSAVPVNDEPHVAEVRIRGELGVPESDIRKRLRLNEDDQFDYYRWQDDRERVLALYHDRGYYEARLTSRREPAEGERIALDYLVRPGPQTTLTIEGYNLPRRVVQRMRTAWTQAVFDGFLIDDLQALARQELIANRYLQATVTVTVTGSSDDASKSAHVAIVPGPRFAERRITFEGNKALDDSLLESAIEARRLEDAAWQDPDAVASALQDFYHSLGYLMAEVTASEPIFQGASATLPIRIEEHEAFTIGTVDVTGPVTRTPDAVRESAALQPGAAYRPNTIEPARRRVEVQYMQAGYNHVRVAATISLDVERRVANIALNVNEGPQQVLARVDIEGADITKPSAIEDAVRINPGTPIDMSRYYAAQKRLYDLGVFRSVDVLVSPLPGQTGETLTEQARAMVIVHELPRFRFRYGLRATDVTEPLEGTSGVGRRQVRPGIVADLLNRNVLGRAISLGVAGQLESDRWLGRGILSFPTVFRLPVTTNIFLTRSRQTFDDDEEANPFTEDSLDLTLEQRLKPSRTMTVIWGYSFTRARTFTIGPDTLFPLDVRQDIGRLSSTYAWDTRNDPSNASRGWFHSSGVEWGSTRLGSDLSFVRYLSQQFYFKPVGQAVFASAVRLGLGRGLGQDRDLLSSEKFYAGGSTTVRGFAEDSLGERDAFGPLGGNSMIVLNQEARFPVYRWVRGVAFLDAGNVFPTIRDASLGTLEFGTGFGLRINSPFAVLRVDYGIPLTSRDRDSRGRWYFSFGQTF